MNKGKTFINPNNPSAMTEWVLTYRSQPKTVVKTWFDISRKRLDAK